MDTMCCFNGCAISPLPGHTKCSVHKSRGMCSVETCANQVYARGLCVRHGGRHRCFQPGCTTSARVGGYCSRHGGVKIKKQCAVDGCGNKVNRNGRCVRHGGRRQCKVSDCVTHARSGGYCSRHAKALDGGKTKWYTDDLWSLNDTESIDELLYSDYGDMLLLLPSTSDESASTRGDTCRGDDIDASILACLFQDDRHSLVTL
ncbi:hypothetical protein SDRG_07515 [Saprolegnia diclina VS20]|uniref:WRKY transcription factor 19 n=1 Tax=Saprolegnia diclina (strain VS20) TaxID=1156394 RepID=T0QN83_SAPDV|nr:hypothetical protein SDRG_07515 [Saprolegnia diclina VS20]EQC35290.1 hypothetical protein SDRG_07515 [Saprolegnia diclina VS20]|eukprot:XP_008611574.1 hypothetical protein SDRG_07515 [Saprolegnia diclina VS20]